ncbi:MAG TPA: peroxiredoxin [Jiangellaceae bacterium]
MAASVRVGDIAPDFELPAQTGETVRLSDHRGKRVVVLYFYPKDETPGCTAEACAFRDSYEVFSEAGAEVIGISSDTVASHERFAGAHRVPFALLSDDGGWVRKSYGAKSSFGLLPGRITYVIDLDGVVRHMFSSMTNIGGHVEGALAVVRELTEQS